MAVHCTEKAHLAIGFRQQSGEKGRKIGRRRPRHISEEGRFKRLWVSQSRCRFLARLVWRRTVDSRRKDDACPAQHSRCSCSSSFVVSEVKFYPLHAEGREANKIKISPGMAVGSNRRRARLPSREIYFVGSYKKHLLCPSEKTGRTYVVPLRDGDTTPPLPVPALP